jgi:HEAT repeat protein
MLDSVDSQIITEMLVSRGEVGVLAERLVGLAAIGRGEITEDPGDARAVVSRMLAGDEMERQHAMLELRAKFGGWAVPALVGPLGDRSSTDNRVYAMQALTRLGSSAVLPLMATLQSDDQMTRRNAAAVLGTIGDKRAAAPLAWMARGDEDAVARNVAGEALGKLGLGTSDPVQLSVTLADGFFRGTPDLVRAYAAPAVIWSWDGKLVGRKVMAGLFTLELAEAYARQALANGAGDAIRPVLAAIHAGQKAEILAAGRLPELAGTSLLDDAEARLPALDVDLALAGSHRGRGLVGCLSGMRPQPAAAVQLMESMGASIEERQALRVALVDSDPTIALGSALALARQGDADDAVVANLAAALAAAPDRLVMSIGNTGLASSGAGWQLMSSSNLAEGLLRAKSLPPKDVIVVQDGLGGVTTDTLVFALMNDPRTADVPLIIATRDVGGVEALYGDKVAKVVSSATLADVADVAGDRDSMQQRALDYARRAADALTMLPGGVSRVATGEVVSALAEGDDDGVRIAIMGLAAHSGMVSALSPIERIVLDDSASTELRVAALNTAAHLWAVNSGAAGNSDALSTALIAMVEAGDELSLSAAAALGQLRGVSDAAISGVIQ